ncbi:MAG: rod shape-determining protein [Hyphomicrobiaceae bacterium]|nr:rod shape-determining protein [Hyphomicrobiaceae bacterium]
MIAGINSVFSDDIAIDLGTASTILQVTNHELVLTEPTVVAIHNRNGIREALAVGNRAKQILGRTPEMIEAIHPLRDGVIADLIVTEEMLCQLIRKIKTRFSFRRPRILVCIPPGATTVERQAVYDTTFSAGARKVYLIEGPVAAAFGVGLDVNQEKATTVIDIGSGTTDIVVMSAGGILLARSLRCAGNVMNEAIIHFIRRKHQMHIGERSAEKIKIHVGAMLTVKKESSTEIRIRGLDICNGRSKNIVLSQTDIIDALKGPVEKITEFVRRSIEDLPSDIIEEIFDNGIYLTGGGANMSSIDTELEKRLEGIGITVPENPMYCVIKGMASVLKNLKYHNHLLIKP